MTLRRTLALCLATLAAGMVFAAALAPRASTNAGPDSSQARAPPCNKPRRARSAFESPWLPRPVVVVGAKGEPVLDLEQKDFHVLDDGMDQTIESFDLGGEQAFCRACL